jgi:hypothetical protein
LRDRFGLVGYVRATEVTHGRSGWHPHLHVLLMTDRVLTLDELRELHQFVRERWIRRVVALGSGLPTSIGASAFCPSTRATGWAAT